MALDDFTSHHWRILDAGEVKVSTTAEELWEQAISYFQWCDENPILKKGTIKSGKSVGTKLTEELPRAYHLKGLCIHCGIEEDWLRDIRSSKNTSNPYYNVVSRILYIIYAQQYELAAVGELNPIFTSKALNMDREETPTGAVKIEFIGDLPALSSSENEVLEKLEAENRANENGDFEKS